MVCSIRDGSHRSKSYDHSNGLNITGRVIRAYYTIISEQRQLKIVTRDPSPPKADQDDDKRREIRDDNERIYFPAGVDDAAPFTMARTFVSVGQRERILSPSAFASAVFPASV